MRPSHGYISLAIDQELRNWGVHIDVTNFWALAV